MQKTYSTLKDLLEAAPSVKVKPKGPSNLVVTKILGFSASTRFLRSKQIGSFELNLN
jgi:hypothetical protein